MLKPDGYPVHFDHALREVGGDEYALAVQVAENIVNRSSSLTKTATLSADGAKALALAFIMLHDKAGPLPGISAPVVQSNGVELPVRLEGRLEAALSGAPSYLGSYDFANKGLGMYEETLTLQEIKVAQEFGNWLTANSKTYGHNLPIRWAEFYREMAEAVPV